MPAEKEKRVGYKKLHLVFLLNDGSERINTVAKIGVAANDIDSGAGFGVGIFKHDAPP